MLKAVKAFTYCTRRLLPGDTFEVKRRNDARVLVALGKAVEVRAPVELAPPPAELATRIAAAAAPQDDDLAIPAHLRGPRRSA